MNISAFANKFFSLAFICAVILLVPADRRADAQVIVDTSKGTHFEARKGYMDGNFVLTVYYNFGEIGDWQNDPTNSGVWPKGTNHTYIDGVAIIVQAEATDPSGNLIHPLETNYYEYTRHDASTGVTYGWWPLKGYAAEYQSVPAESNTPSTWPSHWGDRPSSWDGYWDGFFGKGVLNADLESFWVMDDNEDRQYILDNHFHPDATDTTRGGLAMQVKGRGFQWTQVLAEDVIFWLYDITNLGTTDYRKTVFAQYVDWGIGGHDNSSNNAGDYNLALNLSYAWSTVPYGSPGDWSPVGYAGYAYLESPGIDDDRIDNDHDGLTDERRDNNAKVFITDPLHDPFIADAQTDTATFRQFYGYSWKPHWDADENCNWRTFTDVNGNGKWDPGEPLNDDVGSDGLGPLDPGYPGPDPDGTEGNGRPDQGEPDFGLLDKDESDQIGMTGFLVAAVHTYDLNNDERNWTALTQLPQPHAQNLAGVNLSNWFSSYPFHMYGRQTYSMEEDSIEQTGETERFSMALLFGNNANDLFTKKATVQSIYNANYQFAKPPDKPTIKAIAGDRRVTLYWDNRAELTFDAFYQRYSFEGYRVYRATEPNFISDQTVTDAYGNPTYRVPIAQYDLVDSIQGLAQIGINGAYFYLGDNSGLRHSFIDSTVTNGQTYYYAVSAYDGGFYTTTVTGQFTGIPPSETSTIIEVAANGVVKTDINTAVVTPGAPAAGYVPAKLASFVPSGPGTGTVSIELLNPDSIKAHVYQIAFQDFTPFHTNPLPSYTIYDQTAGDTVVHLTQLKTTSDETPVVSGYSGTIMNDSGVAINLSKSGWTKGVSNLLVQDGFDSRYAAGLQARRVNYPADFDITFTAAGKGDVSFPSSSFSSAGVPSNIVINDVTEGINHFQFLFYDNNSNGMFDNGDAIFLVVGDSAGKAATSFGTAYKSWSISFFQDTTIAANLQRAPQPGDVYHLATHKPFRTGETFTFKLAPAHTSAAQAKSDLSKVAVVPNPYVGAASWEPATTQIGRGERRIYFTHLPAQCTIRIYTISGHLVQTITHQATGLDGQEPWNLISRDGLDIAFGVYVFQIDAPGVGTYVDKFAIMK
jgi:hypothetical protein